MIHINLYIIIIQLCIHIHRQEIDYLRKAGASFKKVRIEFCTPIFFFSCVCLACLYNIVPIPKCTF